MFSAPVAATINLVTGACYASSDDQTYHLGLVLFRRSGGPCLVSVSAGNGCQPEKMYKVEIYPGLTPARDDARVQRDCSTFLTFLFLSVCK